MSMQTFGLSQGRLNKFKGQIIKHAVPREVLGKSGRQVAYPKNMSDTYVARRWLPYGSTAANNGNQFFSTTTGDRGNVITQAHLTQEGVTPTPDSIAPQDISVVMQQYSCLYGFTDKTFELYEDDVPAAMQEQVGERVALVNELIVYGALKANTNQYYGGTGTSRSTVNGKLTLNLIRKVVKALQANHGENVTSILKASPNFGTDAISPGYVVYCHTDLEPDIRDIPGFIPIEKYATGTPLPYEVGKVERFRFVTSPDLPSYLNGGAATGTTGLQGTTGAGNDGFIDVYPVIVAAKDAFSQIAVRGLDSLKPTYLAPGDKSKSDPFGQRGYAGTIWWKAVMIENPSWLSIVNVGVTAI